MSKEANSNLKLNINYVSFKMESVKGKPQPVLFNQCSEFDNASSKDIIVHGAASFSRVTWDECCWLYCCC